MPPSHVVFLIHFGAEHLVTNAALDLSPPNVGMFPSDVFNQVTSETKTFAALHAFDVLDFLVYSLHMFFYGFHGLGKIRALPTWKLPHHTEVHCPYVMSYH